MICGSLGLILDAQTSDAKKQNKFKVDLPLRPPIWERDPDTFKKEDFVTENNMKINAYNTVEEEPDTRDLQGFVGPYYLSEVDGTAVKLIKESLFIMDSKGQWGAMGLIRNETPEIVDKVIVKAELFGEDGNLIDEISEEVYVNSIRPGEPAPFVIHSEINFEEVADVKWKIVASEDNKKFSRSANIQVYWELAQGSEEYRGIKREDDPYPYVLATGFENLGRPVKNADLIAAWLDENGKVVWIETTNLDKKAFANGIDRDGAGNFKPIIVFNKEIGSLLDKYTYMLWVMGK